MLYRQGGRRYGMQKCDEGCGHQSKECAAQSEAYGNSTLEKKIGKREGTIRVKEKKITIQNMEIKSREAEIEVKDTEIRLLRRGLLWRLVMEVV
jgi:hypothetical protein